VAQPLQRSTAGVKCQ